MKINLGCGWRDFGSDWIHIDGGDYEHLDSYDIYLNDYQRDSVDLIYASHIIEYFDREEVIKLLNGWKGVLKRDGVMRIAVPNFSEIASLYVNESYGLDSFVGLLYGKMPMGDKTIYHRTTYDFDSLKTVLESVGMREVDYYNWRETEHSQFDDHSQAYLPHMDKEKGTLMSLNVECKK